MAGVTEKVNSSEEDRDDESPLAASGDADDFDTVLAHVGVGKWNYIYYIAIAYWHVVLPYHTLAGAFLSPSVNHTCHHPSPDLPPTIVLVNNTAAHNAFRNTTHLSDIDNSCSYQKEDLATGRLQEVPCTEWDFDNSTFTSTVTSEFGLVCDRRYLRAAHQSIYMGGILVGAFFNGFLADRYGRLRMIAISVILYCVMALGSAWLPSLGLILTSRFLLGTMHPTSLTTGFILVMEITEIKWRSTAGLLTQGMWAVGTILWGLFAYLERDWRWLQTFVSLLCPVMVPFLFFMNESPRWLVVMGRHKEALSVLQRAARLNGTSLPPKDHLLAVMKNVEQQSSSATAKDISQPNMARRVLNQVIMLFSTKKLITITVVSCIGFFSVALIFFGLTLGASALNIDDPFAYVAISGTMELPSIFTIYMVEKIGRKKSGIGTFALCAFSLLTQPLLPASIGWLSMTLVMTGKMAAACAFDVMFLYSSELYPTEIRMQGLSAGMMASRAGAFIAPFIMSALEPHYPWAISVVFGLMAAVAAVSFIPLWETANTCLPDTMLQLEAKKEDLAADSLIVKVYGEAGSEDEETTLSA